MPVGSALAVVGATAATSAYGASKQAGAAKDAANAQVVASDKANATDLAIYNDQRKLLAPSIQAGADARARQMLMLGSTPDEVKTYLRGQSGAINDNGAANLAAGGEGAPDWQAYYNNNGDLQNHWQNVLTPTERAQYGNNPATWAQAQAGWAAKIGQTRPIPTVGQSHNTAGATPGAGEDLSWVDSYDPQTYLESTPGYKFRLGEGTKALEHSAAARGRLFSGATGKQLTRYGQDYASGEWSNLFDQLGGVAGDGKTATGTSVNIAGEFGDNTTGNIIGAGNARASGYKAAGDAWNGFYSDTLPGAIGRGYGLGKQAGWFGK